MAANGLAPSVMRMPQPPQPELPEPATIDLGQAGDPTVKFDDKTGAMTVERPDGSVLVDFSPNSNTKDSNANDFYENLADIVDDEELTRIASELIEGIEADNTSRDDWVTGRAESLKLLGLKIEQPKSATVASSAPLEGQSVIRHPLLLEANLRFQANARGELLPAAGPVKVRNDGSIELSDDKIANLLERDMNHYLTVGLPEYYPDTDRMLFYVGVGGTGFKKLYHDPIRKKPVSISVDANDIIVSNSATSLADAKRITHVIKMRKSTLRRMQIAGAYLDISLSEPIISNPNEASMEKAEIEGISKSNNRPQDNEYEIYECYCELDLKGFAHKDEKDKETGLEVPYKVSLDKNTRKILEIRRNWREEDKECLPRRVFVKYPFVCGLGFWDIGLGQILGNTTNALTAAWREMLDSGMFANFPGFLYSEAVGRQMTNDFRIPPGGGQRIQTGGQPIGNVVTALPYKDISAGLMQFVDNVAQTAQRLGGTAELNVGEGRADAPVGTTIALIEQATKILDAVHKRLHTAQQEEFTILKELLEEDPEALWSGNKRKVSPDEKAMLIQGLSDLNFVPAADPNTPSRVHRIMQAVAIKQLQAQSPDLYDGKQVDTAILTMIGFSDPSKFFKPPPPPGAAPPDPQQIAAQAKMEAIKQKGEQAQQEGQLKLALASKESQDRAADRQAKATSDAAKLEIERLRLASEQIIHSADSQMAQNKHLNELSVDQHAHFSQLQHDKEQQAKQLDSEHIKHFGQLQATAQQAGQQAQVDLHKHHTQLAVDRQNQLDKMAHDKAIAAAKPKPAPKKAK